MYFRLNRTTIGMIGGRTKVELYFRIRILAAVFVLVQSAPVFSQYKLHLKSVDKDSSYLVNELKLKTNFSSVADCKVYVNALPGTLHAKGFIAASIDSLFFDSSFAIAHIYTGEPMKWARLNTDSVEPAILQAAQWRSAQFSSSPLNMKEYEKGRTKMLDWLENNGYPFAKIELENAQFSNDGLQASLRVEKGPLYHIDSIRNLGSARISNSFLQHYLGIRNASLYRKERLISISKKLTELPYVTEQQPWDLTLLGTGSVVNLYLEPKKSSQINVLVGLLPANQQLEDNKMLVTGEANINLRNALGNGETMGLNWQQIQVKSPRLNLLYQQPYIFKSAFGVNLNFDLLKKDSSYVNITALGGLQYSLSSTHSGTLFIRSFSTNLLEVDTNRVKSTRQLPAEADVRSINIGVNYQLSATDYRLNPRRGNSLVMSVSAGTRNIRKNNAIIKLKDESDPEFDFNSLYDTIQLNSYQFRLVLDGAHYFKLGKTSTIKASLSGGWIQSPDIFRNELFQIGGYKLLRGFDEESIFASAYAVTTAEYRYFMGRNSFLFSFVDLGWTKNATLSTGTNHQFLGMGLGMAFETKAGIFNISYAVGKQDDTRLNFRQAKIHLGYINYF